MLAVIKTGGKQYIVAPGKKFKIEKLTQGAGDDVSFDEVLLLADGKSVRLGQPFVEGAKVLGKVIREGRSKKVIVFKYKPKKRYKKKRGHRQGFSEVEITEILVS